MAQQQPISWKTSVGLNNVGSYQVSGAPFAQGNINASAEHQKIEFPEVSIWIQVINRGAGILKVGFSDVGLSGSNYFEVPATSSSDVLRVKVSELHLYGGTSGQVSVVAGLTNIDSSRTSTSTGASWRVKVDFVEN